MRSSKTRRLEETIISRELNVTMFLLSVVMIAAVKSISLGPAEGHVPNGFSFLCIRDFHRVSVLGYR